MSPKRLPSPQPDDCLIWSRKSRYKGGTIIAEDVGTVEEHRRRLSDPDGYRPRSCGCCGGKTLHVHDYVERRPLGLAVVVALVRFICANPDCRATWRVLPAFLARHLWWCWKAIEQATQTRGGAEETPVERSAKVVPPRTTVRRWLGRLASSARQLVVLMVSRGIETVQEVAEAVGLEGCRRELVEAYGSILRVPKRRVLGVVAALIDRLERGVRLM